MTLNTTDKIETTEVFIEKIANNFSRESCHVDLIIPKSSSNLTRKKDTGYNHIEITDLCYPLNISNKNIEGIIRQMDYTYNCLKFFKSEDYDVIYNLSMGPFYLNSIFLSFISKLKKIPFVNEWLGSDLLLYNTHIRNFIKNVVLKNSTVNFIRSSDMFKKAMKICSDCELVITPSKGVDTSEFIPDLKNKHDNQIIRFLYVGRLHPIKGVTHLIEAFSLIQSEHPKSMLVIVGDGPIKKDLINKANELGLSQCINFIGHVDHSKLVKHYQCADVFILPSISEGMPNTILEAMACGLPVVASDVGGNKDLVKNLQGGFLVRSKSVNELHDAMKKLIDDPRLIEKMGAFNAEYVKRFDQETVLEKKLMVIRKVIHETTESN